MDEVTVTNGDDIGHDHKVVPVPDNSTINGDNSNKTTATTSVRRPRKTKKKKVPVKSKVVTGYIIYASEIRKEIIKRHPDQDFGEISKIVGLEWKNLPQETKSEYERRAQNQNIREKELFQELRSQEQHRQLLSPVSNLTSNDSRPLVSAQPTDQSPQLVVHDIANNGNSDNYQFNNTTSKCDTSEPQHHQQLQFFPQNCANLIEAQQMLFPSSPMPDSQMQAGNVDHYTNGSCSSQQYFNNNLPQQILPQQQHYLSPQQIQSMSQCYQQNYMLPGDPPMHLFQPQQPTASNAVQYCNNNNHMTYTPQQHQHDYSNMPANRNLIFYRTPSTVRSRPKDASTQTDFEDNVAIIPKRKPLKHSERFMNHLETHMADLKSVPSESPNYQNIADSSASPI